MLDSRDEGTPKSINLLVEMAAINDRPIVFWVGAGASSWYGYPRWQNMARAFHGKFKRETNYVKHIAQGFLDSDPPDLPAFFGYCKKVNPNLYQQELINTFNAKHSEPVYSNFIRAIKWFDNPKIVTTNIDEALEHNLVFSNTVQRSDLRRIPGLIDDDMPFIAKLHGSVSTFESAVFTSEDYTNLINDQQYLEILQEVFQKAHVVFFGYGLQDDYLLRLLTEQTIVPTGPHFAVLPRRHKGLPPNIHQIIYVDEIHSDHRAAIRVLQELKYSSPIITIKRERGISIPSRQLRSAHYISDFMPPGTFESSQTFTFDDGEGVPQGTGHVGHGLIDVEMHHQVSTAMHDLAVGLLCFEQVYLPIKSFDRLYHFVGEDVCFDLISAGIFKFIYWGADDAVVYGAESLHTNGRLTTVARQDFVTPEEFIQSFVHPVAGQEEAGHQKIEKLLAATNPISVENIEKVTKVTSSLMIYPSIRKKLGLNEFICEATIPTWLIFPVLRLTHLVRMGIISNLLNIGSTKTWFAHPDLADPVFSSLKGDYWVDDMARFVLSGRYDTDLGYLMLNDRNLIHNILKFRESAAGINFRTEIFEALQVNEGGSFHASINAAMHAGIPPHVLQQARNQFEGLMRPNTIDLPVSALWNNSGDTSLALWKQRSKALLEQHCQTFGILENDKCPCGSGVSLRNCCIRFLSVER